VKRKVKVIGVGKSVLFTLGWGLAAIAVFFGGSGTRSYDQRMSASAQTVLPTSTPPCVSGCNNSSSCYGGAVGSYGTNGGACGASPCTDNERPLDFYCTDFCGISLRILTRILLCLAGLIDISLSPGKLIIFVDTSAQRMGTIP
jgi:hypothetical protein